MVKIENQKTNDLLFVKTGLEAPDINNHVRHYKLVNDAAIVAYSE